MKASDAVDLVRSAQEWTPDFSAGVAELEVEAILTDVYLVYRASSVWTSLFQIVARPEDVRSRRLALAGLAIEAADIAYIWRRTREWRSLQAPDVLPVTTLTGLVSLPMLARAVHPVTHRDANAWAGGPLRCRIAMHSSVTPDLRRNAASAALLAASVVAVPPPGTTRAGFGVLGPPILMWAVQSTVYAHRIRAEAAAVDRRGGELARDQMARLLVDERDEYLGAVLGPLPDRLRLIRSGLAERRPGSVTVAASEERRIRSWLEDHAARIGRPLELDPSDAETLTRTTGYEFGRRGQLTLRVTSSVTLLSQLRKAVPRHPRLMHAVFALAIARSVASVAERHPWIHHRLGPERADTALGVLDVAAVGAAAALEHAEGHRREVAKWTDEYSSLVAATTTRTMWDGPRTVLVTAALSTIRAAVGLLSPRPVTQRLAAAGLGVVNPPAARWMMKHLYEDTGEQGVRLTATATELAGAGHQAALDDQRVRHQAFVHDGVAQLLHAIAVGDLDRLQLIEWIDQELDRLDAELEGSTAGPVSIEVGLEGLTEEFRRRDLAVEAALDELPVWTRPVAGTVVEIVREALNNVVKHTDSRSVWCEAAVFPKSVAVTVTDFSTATTGADGAGTGVGTRTMAALAELIGATVEWDRAPGGGTQVTITLVKP